MQSSLVLVSAALVFRNGSILIGKRNQNARYADAWEFPGGKVEAGESWNDALVRELKEELDIFASQPTLVHRSINTFPDGGRFDVRYGIVSQFEGEPRTLVHQELAWVTPSELNTIKLISGNEEVVALLNAGVWEAILQDFR